VNTVAAPRFAHPHAEEVPEAFRPFVRAIAHRPFGPALVLALGVGAAAPLPLSIFGPKFGATSAPLFFLILNHLVNAGDGSVGYLLDVTGHHADSAWGYGVTVVLHLGLTWGGVRLFGLLEASAPSALIWNVWLHRVVQKQLRVFLSIVTALRSSD